ncbi:MAG TPA: lysophospholipid acyltransferase family protein [Edaphocola sp.]|nr:lysophospholipid acyltransferase family protein [Edaphocola sp.]
MSYYIAYPFLYLLSLLPLSVLYLFSGLLKLLVFDIIGYRKKVVVQNLKNSFPEKSEQEIETIANNFYQYFCEMIVEVLKGVSIGEKQLKARCSIDQISLDLMNGYAQKGQSVILAMAHQGNWEWAVNALSIYLKQHQTFGIYRPLHNKGFDKIVVDLRKRFRLELIPDKEVIGAMLKHNKEGFVHATVFLTDQTPSGKNMYWTNFLHQDTPVFLGIERFSKKFDYPVLFFSVKKKKRGYYSLHLETLTDTPNTYKIEGGVSELHTQAIEKSIVSQPETWLWTHRRWKRKRNL